MKIKTLILSLVILITIQQSFNKSIMNTLEEALSQEIDEDDALTDESETDLRLISILMDRIVIDHIDHIIDNRINQRMHRENHHHKRKHRQHHGIPIPRTG